MALAERLRNTLGRPLATRERRRLRLRARRTTRLAVIVSGAVTAGVAAVLFAKLCDYAQAAHAAILRPGLVGPLMLAALIARGVSSLIMPQPIYHILSRTWLRVGGRELGIEPAPAVA